MTATKTPPPAGGAQVIPVFTSAPYQRSPDPSVIEALRYLLTAAESGEVVGVALVGVRYDDTVITEAQGLWASYATVGGLSYLMHCVNAHRRDNA